ncbi:MAG: NAD(+)/NADH kinase [Spiroplasma endosymbiont of Drosophila atripex]|nr:MAG: NAD(+)/NADH kinase [Spiroplasma endosymbiont of Drosophila atripex]
MKNYKFTIIANKYENSQSLAKELRAKLLALKALEDTSFPDIVFIIGGDGTFLKAVHDYNNMLNTVKFVSFKCGNLGFYENFLNTEVDKVLMWIDKNDNNLIVNKFSLLEVNINNKILYAINEVKFVNLTTTLSCQVLINNQLFENFRGSGLVIATRTGSTGLMKSLGGAVLISNHNLMQFHEIAPVANNSYRSLNSPLILDENHEITLKNIQKDSKLSDFGKLIVDTFDFNDKLNDKVTIKLSELTLQVLEYRLNHYSLLAKVKKAFIQED